MVEATNGTLFFTVFTPTYNRRHLLPRVYESLLKQDFRGFEWIIVDDGSNDNTCDIVEEWTKQAPFSILYVYQENSGKHCAHNRAVSIANGFLFVTVDSDDWLADGALKSIRQAWESIPEDDREKFVGVCGLYADPSGTVVGTPFPDDVVDSDAVEIRTRLGVKGDKFGANRVDVLRQFPFPEDIGSFVTESLVWNRIALSYKTRFVNRLWAYAEYQRDGLSRRSIEIRAKSPYAARLYYKEFLQLEKKHVTIGHRLRACANYVRFSLHARTPVKNLILECPERVLCILGLLLGVLLYFRDGRILRRARKQHCICSLSE